MVKKLISFCVILSVCMLRVSAFEADSVSAECAVVLNLHTDEVFFEKNAQKSTRFLRQIEEKEVKDRLLGCFFAKKRH